jgi:DNA topoisomerase-1
MVELIITEKPNAAKKIAEALADGKAVKQGTGAPYYELTHGGKEIIVGCAVGHLYGLAEKQKTKGFQYPVFDIQWVPTSDVSRGAAFSKKYLDQLKKLAKDATEFTVATDYDVEGEVIGLNIVRYACKQKDARRMKFSTLTKPDLVEAYSKASSHLDWGQAEAGETRHFLDYYYGINLSRALTSAIKTTGMFKILSTGRVQGPALKIIVDREKEIMAFKPVPFWQLLLDGEAKTVPVQALHKEDKFWEKPKAEAIYAKVSGEKKAGVASVEKKQFDQHPPTPFDLTSLQTESYRCFGISPRFTLDIAQDLYTAGLISYPRTSSQQLPPAIGFQRIMKDLSRQDNYTALTARLLKGKLEPHNGTKTDPAHPAIYPTGISPKKLEDRPAKVYDLIVKRFLATFADTATRETMTVELHVKGEPFIARGTTTVKKGWHEFYAPYVPFTEDELPPMLKGDIIDVKKITLDAKETQPPKRYTEASLIKELEKRNLGTKATRANIIETLYERNYASGKAIMATELGIHIISILEKNVPEIVDEQLTRHFEEQMDEIREHKAKGEFILEEARKVLTKLLANFKSKEKAIGEGLKTTFQDTRITLTRVGKCPNCVEGHLALRKGKFGKFIACDQYPNCKTTFKLPAIGLVEVTDKVCDACNHPIIRMIKKAKKPQEVCINPDCPKKVVDLSAVVGKPCPKCKIGKLLVRKSVYGQFIACDQFPKCRYIQRAERAAKTDAPATGAGTAVPGAAPATPSVTPEVIAKAKAAATKTRKRKQP